MPRKSNDNLFTGDLGEEKAKLVRIAEHEDRSMVRVLKRLIRERYDQLWPPTRRKEKSK